MQLIVQHNLTLGVPYRPDPDKSRQLDYCWGVWRSESDQHNKHLRRTRKQDVVVKAVHGARLCADAALRLLRFGAQQVHPNE